MLNIMRKNASSWLIKILFAIIVFFFIFWGVGSFQDMGSDRVALVNGEPISIDSYRYAYQNYVDTLRQQYGDTLTQETLEMFQVSRSVISSLVTEQLLLQEAEKLNIRVTDEELASAIQSMNVFQDAGTFSSQYYEYLLERNDLTPEAFETSQRQSMLTNRLNALVTSGIKVTEGEIQEWYEWINTSVDLNYVLFDPDSVDGMEPTEEELTAFYDTKKENYRTNPKMKVRYLSFRPDRFADSVHIEDDEIQEYYDMNQSEFQKEKTVEARHILLSLDADASPEVVEEKRKKAEEIFIMADEGKDFAELAKEYSEGATRETGGLLGEFKKSDMDASFSDAAFSMEAGEISEPVRTQYGWHLIKLEKINEASIAPLEDVSDDIRKTLTLAEEKELAYEAADDAFDQALMDEDFEKTASDLGLSLQTTDYFTEDGRDILVSNPKAFASAAFELTDTDISDVLNIGDNYYILQKTDELASEIPELSIVLAQVKADLIKKMQDEEAQRRAEEFLAGVKDEGDLEASAMEVGLDMSTSGFFKRSEGIPGIGYVSEMIQAAFLLSESSKTADQVFQANGGYYVVQFRARELPDSAELESQRETIKAQLISQKQQIVFDKWLAGLESESEIVLEDGYLD